MEKYFKRFRDNIIGIDQTFVSPFGRQKIVYADWIASGRLYGPIERTMMERVGPFVAKDDPSVDYSLERSGTLHHRTLEGTLRTPAGNPIRVGDFLSPNYSR